MHFLLSLNSKWRVLDCARLRSTGDYVAAGGHSIVASVVSAASRRDHRLPAPRHINPLIR